MNEPPLAAVKMLASPLSRAEERALAKELLGPLLPLARSGELGIVGPGVVPALARIDPLQVIEMIENRAVGNVAGCLIQVALGQYEDDPAVAIATINDDNDPGSRAAAWLVLEAYRPAPDRSRRENLLERALADAHRVVQADVKVGLLSQIADRWLELGSIERARPIVVEGQAILTNWPKDNWFFGAEGFATTLAIIDLPAAMAIFERRGWTNVSRPDANTIVSHNAQVAIRLAGIDPAEAERLLAPPSGGFFGRDWIVLKVARKMARVDLPRARRVLETVDDESSGGMTVSPALVPFGVGELAGELATSNPVEARRMLDEAFAGLRQFVIENGYPTRGPGSVANLMAKLLPIVEQLDPDRLAERVWLVAASRAPAVQEPTVEDLEGTFALAMRIARYDRAIADVIAAGGLERLPDLLGESAGQYKHNIPTILKNLTAYDPRAITPLLRALPVAARKPGPKHDTWRAASLESQVRLTAAQVLGFPHEARPNGAGRFE
jgi:hypothetical protein